MIARFYKVRDVEVKEISSERLVKLVRGYVRSKREDVLSDIVICVDFTKLCDLYRMMRPGKA